ADDGEAEVVAPQEIFGQAADVLSRDGVDAGYNFRGRNDLPGEDFLATEPAGDGAGVFETQEHAPLCQLLGAVQLLFRDAVAQLRQLLDESADCNAAVRGVDGGVDAE